MRDRIETVIRMFIGDASNLDSMCDTKRAYSAGVSRVLLALEDVVQDDKKLEELGLVCKRVKAIQEEQRIWALDNFGPQEAIDSFMGMVEELGELAHADLKAKQGIRTNEDHNAMARDAMGDIVIYALGVCNARGWDLEEVTQEAWDGVVKKRDWKANPESGI